MMNNSDKAFEEWWDRNKRAVVFGYEALAERAWQASREATLAEVREAIKDILGRNGTIVEYALSHRLAKALNINLDDQ